MGWPKGKPRGPRKPPEPEAVDAETSTKPKTGGGGVKWAMKAGNNWVDAQPLDDAPDRLHISQDEIPEGMDLQWCTESVYGQSFPQRMSQFERGGWTPVYQSDFDGRFAGRFMPAGLDDIIKVEGLVLCARPIEYSLKARARDQRRAREQVAVKEAALTSGQMEGVTGAQHPSAVRFNHIRRSIEQVEIPKE